MRYHLTPVCKVEVEGTQLAWRLSITQQTTSAGEAVGKGESFFKVMGMQTFAATVENSMEFSQKLTNGTAL